MARPVAPTSEYTVADQRRMESAERYFRWQYRLAEEQLGRRVLEVGCGLGNFTRLLMDRELVVAIDSDAACIEALRERLGGRDNLVARQLDITNGAVSDLQQYALDTIACLNVLEHIQDDRLALTRMHEILTPGGRIVLIVPAFEALYGPIDTRLGHYRRYTKKTFCALAESVGFDPIVMSYSNSVGCLGWWVNAHVLKKTQQSERQIAVFDRLIVPVLSRLERMVPPPFGQSIFAVLAKR